jgi:hypothetical protein
LATAEAVHNLTQAKARRRYRVHLRAVCVVFFEGSSGLFVNDGKSSIYVEAANHKILPSTIHAGTWLDIEGVSGGGEYAPIIDGAVLRVIGERPIPAAREVSLDRLSTGVDDGQWISFEGTVKSVTPKPSERGKDFIVTLMVGTGRFEVEVNTEREAQDYSKLVDARVRVRGAASPVFNQRRQLTGILVYSPSLSAIQVLKPAPVDLFSGCGDWPPWRNDLCQRWRARHRSTERKADHTPARGCGGRGGISGTGGIEVFHCERDLQAARYRRPTAAPLHQRQAGFERRLRGRNRPAGRAPH